MWGSTTASRQTVRPPTTGPPADPPFTPAGLADSADESPCLPPSPPVVFGHHISNATLRALHIEGSASQQDKKMGGCRGGSVYFAKCTHVAIVDVTEADYDGEGLSFQMCRDITIDGCRFDRNTGNGLHPGAGSTNCSFT